MLAEVREDRTMHGYHVTWSLNQKRTETFVVAPNPAAAGTALRASLGGMPVVILAMRASHPGMPRWTGAPITLGSREPWSAWAR